MRLDPYTQALAVIGLVERGFDPHTRMLWGVTQACDEVGILPTTFRRQLAKNVELERLFAEAEKIRDEYLADVLLRIDQFESDPKRANTLSSNIKWLLERRRREVYGQHVKVEHTTSKDEAVLAALKKGQARIENARPAPELIEGVSYTQVDVGD